MDGLIRSVLDKNGITFLPIAKMSIREIKRIIAIYKQEGKAETTQTASLKDADELAVLLFGNDFGDISSSRSCLPCVPL